MSLKFIEDNPYEKSAKSIKFKEKNEVFQYKSENKIKMKRSRRSIKSLKKPDEEDDDDCCQLI